jgi:hypothetical protein
LPITAARLEIAVRLFVTCPACRTKMSVEPERLGRTEPCPRCLVPFVGIADPPPAETATHGKLPTDPLLSLVEPRGRAKWVIVLIVVAGVSLLAAFLYTVQR